MFERHTLYICVACVASATSAGVAAPARAAESEEARAPEAAEVVPYEVAFTSRNFRRYDELTLSADGARVAYVIVTPPAERPQAERFLSSGTPVNAVGSHIHLTESRIRVSATQPPMCGERGSQWNPSWSPDGKQLAFYSDADGLAQLWVYTVETRNCRRVSEAPIRASVFSGYEAAWSPDGRTLYVPLLPTAPAQAPLADEAPGTPHVFVSGDEEEGANRSGDNTAWLMGQYNATLAAIDLASGRPRTIADATMQPRPATLRISPSGKWMSFSSVIYRQSDITVSYVMDLGVIPAAGGQPRVLRKALRHSEHSANYLQPDYRWHSREDRLIYLHEGGLWLVDFGADGAEPPRRLASGLGELAPFVAFFTRDGRAVLVGTQPSGEGRNRVPRALAIVPLDGSGPTVLTLPDVQQWRLLDVLRANEGVLWQPDGRSITVLLRHKHTAEQAVARIDLRSGTSKIVDRGLYQLTGLESAGNHDMLLGVFEEFATPPDLYRFSENFASKQRLTVIDDRLTNARAGTIKVFETRVPLHDGTLHTARTTLLLPPGARKGERLPAVVMLYAGSDLSTRATTFGGGMGNSVPNLIFTTRGFAVLMPEMTLAPQGQASEPVQDMTDVLLPQVYRAANIGYVDIDRLAVSGQSYGGYSTAAIVSRTHLFRAGIPINGIFDLAASYGRLDLEGGDAKSIGWAEKGQGRMGDSPWANPQRYIDNSPYYRIGQIRTPLLIVTGEQDVIVPSEESQKFFVGLRRMDRPAELLVYPGEGHSISDWSTVSAVDVSRRMVDFLKKHLAAKSD